MKSKLIVAKQITQKLPGIPSGYYEVYKVKFSSGTTDYIPAPYCKRHVICVCGLVNMMRLYKAGKSERCKYIQSRGYITQVDRVVTRPGEKYIEFWPGLIVDDFLEIQLFNDLVKNRFVRSGALHKTKIQHKSNFIKQMQQYRELVNLPETIPIDSGITVYPENIIREAQEKELFRTMQRGRPAKTYAFKDPDGYPVIVRNLYQFAKSRGLSQPGLHDVHTGKHIAHKGWTKW